MIVTRLLSHGAEAAAIRESTQAFDFIVVGAGMAGASVAAALADTTRVALIEAEPHAGFHATGRSAAAVPTELRQSGLPRELARGNPVPTTLAAAGVTAAAVSPARFSSGSTA